MSHVHLPRYANFLRTKLLKDLAAEELAMLRQMDVPLLRLLSLKPEAEIVHWLTAREDSFLTAVEADEAMKWEAERFTQWEQDAIPGIPKGGLHPSDVLLFHTAQRSAFLRFVGRYTQNPHEKVGLLREIEDHFTTVLAEAMKVYQRMSQRAGRT
jgi:hypothetical protein